MSADTAKLIAWATCAYSFGPDDIAKARALAAALEAAEAHLITLAAAYHAAEAELTRRDDLEDVANEMVRAAELAEARAEAAEAREKALEDELRKAREGWDGWQERGLAMQDRAEAAEAQRAESERNLDLVRGGYEITLADLKAAEAQRDTLAAAGRAVLAAQHRADFGLRLDDLARALAAVEPPEEQP